LEEGKKGLDEVEQDLLPEIFANGSYRNLRDAVEAINMVQVGQMILPSSLYRTESRGYNQRLDFPNRDDKNWLKNTIITQRNDRMNIDAQPVDLLFFRPEDLERA
jgi:succinate dehydrogenase/fumarate reductase flavoprotein subunit